MEMLRFVHHAKMVTSMTQAPINANLSQSDVSTRALLVSLVFNLSAMTHKNRSATYLAVTNTITLVVSTVWLPSP